MQAEATRFIEAGGGKVVGSVKHPLGAADFSSYLVQAQSSNAKAIVVINAGLDTSNALKQASEFRITRGGQILTSPGMTINSVTAMGLDVAQGLQFTVPFYWDRDADSRAWAKRYMEEVERRRADAGSTAAHYSAMTHYLKAVKEAGTDAGPAVMAKMRATPVNDFQMKNVTIREDGQADAAQLCGHRGRARPNRRASSTTTRSVRRSHRSRPTGRSRREAVLFVKAGK